MFLDNIATTFSDIVTSFKINLNFAASIIGILWLFNAVNWLIKYRLNYLGVYPRTFRGLFGIFFAPLLHHDFNHLFFNSIPLFVLSNLVMMRGLHHFYCVSLTVILLGGFFLWLFGSKNIHIGASGLIMGYFGYLIAHAYTKLDASSIILAILALYYFGGLVAALFPSSSKNVSWAGHVFGFIAGIAAIYLCPFFS